MEAYLSAPMAGCISPTSPPTHHRSAPPLPFVHRLSFLPPPLPIIHHHVLACFEAVDEGLGDGGDAAAPEGEEVLGVGWLVAVGKWGISASGLAQVSVARRCCSFSRAMACWRGSVCRKAMSVPSS